MYVCVYSLSSQWVTNVRSRLHVLISGVRNSECGHPAIEVDVAASFEAPHDSRFVQLEEESETDEGLFSGEAEWEGCGAGVAVVGLDVFACGKLEVSTVGGRTRYKIHKTRVY